MSIIELVQQVADYWKLDKSLIKPISSDSLNQEAKRPKKTGFILDKTTTDLGYRPHSFVEGLKLSTPYDPSTAGEGSDLNKYPVKFQTRDSYEK